MGNASTARHHDTYRWLSPRCCLTAVINMAWAALLTSARAHGGDSEKAARSCRGSARGGRWRCRLPAHDEASIAAGPPISRCGTPEPLDLITPAFESEGAGVDLQPLGVFRTGGDGGSRLPPPLPGLVAGVLERACGGVYGRCPIRLQYSLPALAVGLLKELGALREFAGRGRYRALGIVEQTTHGKTRFVGRAVTAIFTRIQCTVGTAERRRSGEGSLICRLSRSLVGGYRFPHSETQCPSVALFAPPAWRLPGGVARFPHLQSRRADPVRRSRVADDFADRLGRPRGAGSGLDRPADHAVLACRRRDCG